MGKKLEEIREALIDKMHDVLTEDKITSTEQLLNFAKAYDMLCGKSEIKGISVDKDTI